MTDTLPRSDKITSWLIDRLVFANNYLARKTHANRGSLITSMTTGGDGTTPIGPLADDRLARVSLTVSWIYSDIQMLANEGSSANLYVEEIIGEERRAIKNHPLELLMENPNGHLTKQYLLSFSIAWLCLDGNAFWYLSPAKRNRDQIVEIWPVPANRMRAVPDKKKFISAYMYRSEGGMYFKVDPEYIVHFQLFNPFSLTDGLSKLSAATLPMQTDLSASRFQRDFYDKGRGIPHSVISLSPDMSDPDFFAAEAKLKEDFEDGRKIAVVRAGEFDVNTVGINQRDMQVVEQREFTRDEIDSIFLGVPFRKIADEAGLKQADKMMVEKGVRPLHINFEQQISMQVLHRFYGKQYVARFEDIRAQDRAVAVQERTIYWQAKTLNEARADLGMPPFEHPDLPGLGELPMPMVKDPAFVTMLFGIGLDFGVANIPGRADEIRRRASGFQSQLQAGQNLNPILAGVEAEPASMAGADSPQRITASTSNPQIYERKAIDIGIKEELKRWKKVALKELEAGKNPGEREFLSDVIPVETSDIIQAVLLKATTPEHINIAFSLLRV